MERRKSERFEIELKCRLKIDNNRSQIADARTINMSRLGALIEISGSCNPEAVPQPRDVLRAEIFLPTNLQFGPRCLSVKATAVRTSKGDGAYIVAVQFQRIEIVAVQPAEELQSKAVM
jgi:hypothetical protein